MAKDRHQNHYGTFVSKKSGYKKLSRNFVTAFIAVIFVLALGIMAYHKYTDRKQPNKQAITESSAISQIPGWWYEKYFGQSVCETKPCALDSDPDSDKLTNAQEYYYHSDPNKAHTIGDAMTDGELVANNFDPSKPGKVSFDQVISDDNVMGESLLFNSDVTQLINESINPNAVQLPTVDTLQLKVSDDNTRDGIVAYSEASKKIMAKYFPADVTSYIESVSVSPDAGNIAEVKGRCVQAIGELKALSVPSEFLQLHKYSIMILTLLPDVINVPDGGALGDEYNLAGNAWFDKTQAMMAVYQKLDLEGKRLENKFK